MSTAPDRDPADLIDLPADSAPLAADPSVLNDVADAAPGTVTGDAAEAEATASRPVRWKQTTLDILAGLALVVALMLCLWGEGRSAEEFRLKQLAAAEAEQALAEQAAAARLAGESRTEPVVETPAADVVVATPEPSPPAPVVVPEEPAATGLTEAERREKWARFAKQEEHRLTAEQQAEQRRQAQAAAQKAVPAPAPPPATAPPVLSPAQQQAAAKLAAERRNAERLAEARAARGPEADSPRAKPAPAVVRVPKSTLSTSAPLTAEEANRRNEERLASVRRKQAAERQAAQPVAPKPVRTPPVVRSQPEPRPTDPRKARALEAMEKSRLDEHERETRLAREREEELRLAREKPLPLEAAQSAKSPPAAPAQPEPKLPAEKKPEKAPLLDAPK